MSTKPKPAEPATTAKTKPTTHTLRMWEIIAIYRTINEAGPIKLPMRIVAFRISLNKNLLKPFVEAYNDQVKAIQEQFVKRDPKTKQMLKKTAEVDGKTVELNEYQTDDADGWNKAVADLGQVPHEITFHAIKLEDFGKAEITQGLSDALVYMVEE